MPVALIIKTTKTMKLLLIFTIITLFIVINAISEEELNLEWDSFKAKFKKSYDEAEELYRKGIFANNLEKIKEHNKKYERGEVTFTQGINQFADLSHEEFKKILGGRPSGIRQWRTVH